MSKQTLIFKRGRIAVYKCYQSGEHPYYTVVNQSNDSHIHTMCKTSACRICVATHKRFFEKGMSANEMQSTLYLMSGSGRKGI